MHIAFRPRSILSWKQRRDGHRIVTLCVYVMIFAYLILFNVFNSVYMDSTPEPKQPTRYDIENIAVNPVSCSFFISGYYERTPRYICYLLLVLTVVIRNRKWLAAGAAASVLTYSGVAAIHMIVLFATNNRLKLQKGKSHCESLPTLGVSTPFVACTGVYDPDVDLSMTIISSVMLGALPVVAWSTTFRRSTSTAILIFWLLLVAMGQTCYPLIESNPGSNFQICPKGYIETIPSNFHAPPLDQSWRDSFSELIATAQEISQHPRNGSSPACIYSCFATAGYSGRKIQDITVWESVPVRRPVIKGHAATRLDAILYSWSYALLVFLTLFTADRKGWLFNWSHKLVFVIEYQQRFLASSRRWKIVTNIAIKGTADSMSTTHSSEATASVDIRVAVLKMVQLLT